MKIKWKMTLAIFTAIILVFIIIFSLNKGIEVEVFEANPRCFKKTLKEEGSIVSSDEYTLYPAFNSKILHIPIEEGHKVKKGDLLAVLETEDLEFQLKELIALEKSLLGEQEDSLIPPYESEINIQELIISKAKQDFEYAKIDFERSKTLYEAGAIPKSEFEDAKNILDGAENNFLRQQKALSLLYESSGQNEGNKKYYIGKQEALKAQRELLEQKIQKGKIYSPIDGIIGNLNIKYGEYVNTNTPIVTVFSDNSYEVEVFVLSEDARNIHPGMEVDLILEDRKKNIIFKGAVKTIAPKAIEMLSSLGLEECRIKVTLTPQIPQDLKIYPGSNIDVEFTLEKRGNQLVLPKTTVFPYQNKDAVWIVEDGKAKLQLVKLGPENDKDVVILEGLKKGTLVISNPKLKGLGEGQKISFKKSHY